MKAIVLGGYGYARPFIPEYQIQVVTTGVYPYNNSQADLLVFTGGEDLDPATYGDEDVGSHFYGKRDIWEKSWYRWALINKVPMAGICRGMQFFTAMTGGKLLQHVNGHSYGPHDIIIPATGEKIQVNSLHHQMCVPKEGTYELLAFAESVASTQKGSNAALHSYASQFVSPDKRIEPEALWFPGIKALGVQFHPEMLDKQTAGYQWFKSIMHKYIIGK